MTLHSERFGQCYHSRHGARTESDHVFLDAGYEAAAAVCGTHPMRILELGLGTGLNALLTLDRWRNAGCPFPLEYIALEPFPLTTEERADLALGDVAGPSEEADLHANPEADLHKVDWGHHGQFSRRKTTWQAFAKAREERGTFDVIYFDAFAPDSQPELWAPERFREAFLLLREGGLLVTYCAKGAVRRAMQSAGFKVERRPGPPGKREMLRARRPPWDEMDIQRFNVRVYFFLLDRPLAEGGPALGSRVLLSDEFLAGRDCTKLPGGGLEFGEGDRWIVPDARPVRNWDRTSNPVPSCTSRGILFVPPGAGKNRFCVTTTSPPCPTRRNSGWPRNVSTIPKTSANRFAGSIWRR